MNILRRFDWQLIAATGVLGAAGILSLFSSNPQLAQKQILWYVFGFALMFAAAVFDWRPFINERGLVFSIYILSVALVVLTYFSPPIRGIRAWITFGPLQFQPSEFIKAALIIMYAYFFARRHVSIARLSNIFKSFLFLILPAGLIVLQPDLGSVLILFAIWAGFLLISGIHYRHLAVAAIIAVVAGFFLWQQALQEYQKERILGLFSPERDPLGVNYSAIQSKIAIGSAGLFGKGFGQGTQVQLGFLPEAENDFIFAAFTEEWGLLGAFLVIAAFFFLVLRIIKIGSASERNFFRFVCLGTAVLFLSHFILNVGSNIGLTPVIGVPYPFFSYGGSNLLTNFLLIGIIQSIKVRGWG